MWNKPDAPAPTQDATIYDVLDPNVFDLNTFQFTRVGFLKWDVPWPGGQTVSTRVDCRPEMNIAVDVKGTFNPETGRIDWWFHTVDPVTGDYPDDPQAGLLPPFNPATGYEVGWMEFTVKPKDDLTTGTQIANQAFVQFDFLGPWGPAPKQGPWINTIDALPPASRVEDLPPQGEGTSFEVRWQGDDEQGAGSGVAGYDVYYRVDGQGDYVLWLDDTTDTSATFTGQVWHSYEFLSVATDNVGHREPMPSAADAHTQLIPANLGPIAFLQRGGLDPSAATGWYRCQATRDALLTLEADFAGDPATVELTLYDANRVPLTTSTATSARR